MKFSVSIIIPVYNAEQYIEKAINSVLNQSVVAEVIVVNDGSTDNSIKLIEELQEKDNRIKIYHHKNNKNKGRSASRNLALQKTSQPFIAFLDADDYYLENRFLRDKEVFTSYPTIDGVYNAIGSHFYREATKNEKVELQLTTVSEAIPHTKLFEYLLNGEKGYFSIDGLTIKKEVIDKIGCFKEQLVVAEDTDWLLKMALICILQAGNITNAVAIRGVHDSNIFNQSAQYKVHRQKMFESVIVWCFQNSISNSKIDLLLNWLFYYRYKEKNSFRVEFSYWFNLLKKQPKFLRSSLAIKYCPIIRQRKKLFPILFR